MPQKEVSFTGFIAHYGPKKKILEKENYFSKKLGHNKATNWSEIDKDKMTALELIWHDKSKIKIDKKEYPHIKPDDWFFSQHATFDMESQSIVVVSRNIGYKKGDIIQIYTVEEETGILKTSVRNG